MLQNVSVLTLEREDSKLNKPKTTAENKTEDEEEEEEPNEEPIAKKRSCLGRCLVKKNLVTVLTGIVIILLTIYKSFFDYATPEPGIKNSNTNKVSRTPFNLTDVTTKHGFSKEMSEKNNSFLQELVKPIEANNFDENKGNKNEKTLAGRWKLASQENMDEFLREIGFKSLERQLYLFFEPIITLSNNQNQWTISVEGTEKTFPDVTYENRQNFDEDTPYGKSKSYVIIENPQKQTHVSVTNQAEIITTRELVGDNQMKMTIKKKNGDILATQMFNRL